MVSKRCCLGSRRGCHGSATARRSRCTARANTGKKRVGKLDAVALRLLAVLGPDRVVVVGDVVAREAWLPILYTCGKVADRFRAARRVRDELIRAALSGEAQASGNSRASSRAH